MQERSIEQFRPGSLIEVRSLRNGVKPYVVTVFEIDVVYNDPLVDSNKLIYDLFVLAENSVLKFLVHEDELHGDSKFFRRIKFL